MMQEDTDLQKIKELIEIMEEKDLLEMEIKHGDDEICLKRSQPQAVIGGTIAAVPLLGQDAGSAASGSPSEKGPVVAAAASARVEPQTVICIIEAMKVMNEIKAETSGTIAEVAVSNGQAVEYGQVLFRVRPEQ